MTTFTQTLRAFRRTSRFAHVQTANTQPASTHLANKRFAASSLVSRINLERLTILWSFFRVVVFVLSAVQLVSLPLKAQRASQSALIPYYQGYNIVGRVVSAENASEGVARCHVALRGGHISTLTDEQGYYVFTNIMNGKYSVEISTPEGSETGASRTIVLRGNDVNVPVLSVEEPLYAVCGRVTYAHDRTRGLANVSIRLSNGLRVSTDSLGYYALDHLRYNETYSLSAEASGLTVYGASRTVKITKALTRQNFLVESPAMATNESDSLENMSKNQQQSEVLIGLPKVNAGIIRPISQK